MYIEAGIALLGMGAYWKNRQREQAKALANNPSVQAQHNVIYDTAINSVHDSAKLMELATAFRVAGDDVRADMLEKRARLNSADPELKAKRREVFRKAMESTDKQAILDIAQVFDNEGATGAANTLRTYAMGLPDT